MKTGKTIHTVVLIALFVTMTALAYADGRDVRMITKSIKTLALSVELWANDHQGKYPTSREFHSEGFLKYVKKVDPAEAQNKLCCPCSGRYFLYERRQSEKDYIIACPRPRNYGMKSIYYQRSKGVVTEEP